MERILIERDKALKALAGKLEGFYLAGGTALSLFYFHHRESYDLDFFTKEFFQARITSVISDLASALGRKIVSVKRRAQKEEARITVYYLRINKKDLLKIDFVEDVIDLLKPIRVMDNIPILSLEDIYIRKIFAICGSRQIENIIGKKIFIGGRQEARDFFDLYFLSKTFMPLSKFAFMYCDPPQRESIVAWYRRYDRFSMQGDILEIETNKEVSYRDMESHFKREISRMVKKEFE